VGIEKIIKKIGSSSIKEYPTSTPFQRLAAEATNQIPIKANDAVDFAVGDSRLKNLGAAKHKAQRISPMEVIITDLILIPCSNFY
jgi:hypothetical protein